MVLHQDAFAVGLDDDEYTLLGMAVKYAGLYGVAISVIGKITRPSESARQVYGARPTCLGLLDGGGDAVASAVLSSSYLAHLVQLWCVAG